jgi:transposase-like protein
VILAGSYFLTKGAGMKKYRYFPLEYKQRIVQEIESGLRTKAAIAREEHLASSLIDRWQKHVREGTLVDHPSAGERRLMRENDWLKKKVAEQAMEIDLLKKIDEYSRRMRRSNGLIVTGRNMESRKDVRS